MAVFHKNRCLSIRFYVQNAQNGTSLRGTASFDVFCVKVSVGTSDVGQRKNQKKHTFIFHQYGEKSLSDLHKILNWGDIQDAITNANFRVDRLRVLTWLGVKY